MQLASRTAGELFSRTAVSATDARTGFGWFVLVQAFMETRRVRKFNMYTFLIWGELAA